MTDYATLLLRATLAAGTAIVAWQQLREGPGDLLPYIACIAGLTILAMLYARGARAALTTPPPTRQFWSDLSRMLMFNRPVVPIAYAVIYGSEAYAHLQHIDTLPSGLSALLVAGLFANLSRKEIRKARERAAARPLGPSIEQIP